MVIGLIPARLKSSRIKNKPLIKIGNKPIIVRTLKNAEKSKKLSKLIVCTDDQKIANVVTRYNGKSVITKKKHSTGTDRIAEVAKKIKCNLIVDIQCDDIFVTGNQIDKLIEFHKKNLHFDIVVPYSKIKGQGRDTSVVKLVNDKNNKVIYMSRENIPFDYKKKKFELKRHLDIISFKKKSLIKFSKLKKSLNEKKEGIELMRALDNNFCVGTFFMKFDYFSINTKKDFQKAKKILS